MSTTAKINREYRHRYPEKAKAHAIVNELIRSKRLLRKPCERCGAAKTHAHHEDYSKPLEVTWLCQPCHVERHKELVIIDPEKWKHYPNQGKPKAEPKPRAKKKPYEPKARIYPKQAQKPAAEALRSQGASCGEIATALGISKGTIFKWLNNVNYD